MEEQILYVLFNVSPSKKLRINARTFIKDQIKLVANKLLQTHAQSIDQAVRMIFVGEVAAHALAEGHKAVVSDGKLLEFKPQTILKELPAAENLSSSEVIFLTAVLEYITAEILEISAALATSNKKVYIITEFIIESIRNDPELNSTLND